LFDVFVSLGVFNVYGEQIFESVTDRLDGRLRARLARWPLQ
jgi:hypothetical protein